MNYSQISTIIARYDNSSKGPLTSPYAHLHQASHWVNQNYLYLGRRVVALAHFIKKVDEFAWNREIKTAKKGEELGIPRTTIKDRTA